MVQLPFHLTDLFFFKNITWGPFICEKNRLNQVDIVQV